MIMTNECRSAFKRVHSAEEAEELRAAGWTVAEEKPAAVEREQGKAVTEPPMKAPRIVKGGKNQLMYKDKYLSQWASFATKKELKEIFDHFGIPYSYNINKNEMIVRLRQYIREVKAEKRRETDDGE